MSVHEYISILEGGGLSLAYIGWGVSLPPYWSKNGEMDRNTDKNWQIPIIIAQSDRKHLWGGVRCKRISLFSCFGYDPRLFPSTFYKTPLCLITTTPLGHLILWPYLDWTKREGDDRLPPP